MKKIKIKAGDIFSIQLAPKMYIFGRVNLNIYDQCVKSKLLQNDSALYSFNKSVLVEIYSGISANIKYMTSDILIPGVFVDMRSLENKTWEIIDYQQVNPEKVEFPEALIGFGTSGLFRKGEIVLPIKLSYDQIRDINVYPTIESSENLHNTCLFYLGRKDLINDEWKDYCSLENSDFRFSQHRNNIYKLLKLSKTISYYDASKKYGFDIRRFYNNLQE